MPQIERNGEGTIAILVVEDHPLTRMGIKALLERRAEFCVIGEASNGVEAVELADELTPDLIIMDIHMPKLNGIEAAGRILQRHPNIKILMLSSLNDEQVVAASLASGATGFCLKDVEPARLYAAIDAVHAGDVWLDSAIGGVVLGRGATKKKVSTGHSFFTHDRNQCPQISSDIVRKPASKNGKYIPSDLSARELQVLALLVDGLNNQEIAIRLAISVATAKTHVRNIFNKLAVNDRTQAVVEGIKLGIVT